MSEAQQEESRSLASGAAECGAVKKARLPLYQKAFGSVSKKQAGMVRRPTPCASHPALGERNAMRNDAVRLKSDEVIGAVKKAQEMTRVFFFIAKLTVQRVVPWLLA